MAKNWAGVLSTSTSPESVKSVPAAAADAVTAVADTVAVGGTVTEANLMMDRATGRPRGFAFVTMGSPEEAQKAIDAMNGATLDGRNLTVNEARPKEERTGGGFRGGRDRGAHAGYGRRY